MPLLEVRDADVSQRCSRCDAVRSIGISSLEAGIVLGAQQDDRIVRLPSCTGCGATEFLIRSHPRDVSMGISGTAGHLHRLLVDHLHAELVRRDQHINGAAPGGERSFEAWAPAPSQEELRQWFPHGLKIEAPPGVSSAPRTDAS